MAAPIVDGEYLKVVEKTRRDLRVLIANKNCAHIMVRLAWHDAGTYDVNTKTGGANGSIRFEDHGPDSGLKIAIDLCESVKAKHSRITYADLYQLAGVVAIEVTGGPTIDFIPGRRDSAVCRKEQLFFGPHRGMGLLDKDIVALCGSYVLGRPHISGLDGPWTNEPLKFDNTYFVKLLEWESEGPLRVPTDRELVEEPDFRQFVELYAEDEDAFFKDYAESHKKLSELGFTPRHTSSAAKSDVMTSTILAHSVVGVAVAATMIVVSYLYEVSRKIK